MKTTNFVFKFLIMILLLNFIHITTGICGSGGGSGKPMSPYKKDEVITQETIFKIRTLLKPFRLAILPESYNYNYFFDVGFIYIQNIKNLIHSEQLYDVPENYKFSNFGVSKISFDKTTNKLILNGLMSIQERNILLNSLFQLTEDKEFRIQVDSATERLYLFPRLINEIFYYFEGYSDNEEKQIIYLSEIETFKILDIDTLNNKILLEIEKFPDISPKKLLSEKPTYTNLKKNYTSVIRLWVNSLNERGEELYFANIRHIKNYSIMNNFYKLNRNLFNGKDYYINDEIKLINFHKNDKIKLRYDDNNIWWATPSVTEDKEYPYRYQLMH